MACSTHLPAAGVKAYDACDYARATKVFEGKANEGDKNFVLYNLAILSSAIHGGDEEKAEKASQAAQQTMWSDVGKGRGEASLVSAEAIKIFKGEPFEKAMAAIYGGIIYYNKGDYDNARASFTKATLAIKQKEKNRDDFALAYLLLAKLAFKLGEDDNARIALENVKKVYPHHPLLSPEKLKAANIIFLAELGKMPEKVRKGPGGSLIEWQRRNYPERGVEIEIDGAAKGEGAEIADLTNQARSKGWTGKDTVQITKGITHDAAAATTVIAANEAAKGNETAGWVALGAGLFMLADQSKADTREWELLPDRILTFGTHLAPGRHEVRVRFYAEGKSPLPRYDQLWYYDIQTGEERMVLVRGQPCPPKS